LEILEALEDLNGFEFTSAVAEHMYVRLVFFGENPESIYLSYVSDGVWQREYPIDSADYSIKVPADKGIYNFFAYITWENGDTETIFFDITVQ